VRRIATAIAVLAALWSWDAIVFTYSRSWSAWLPLGLAVIFVVALSRRRETTRGDGRWVGPLALGLALLLVELMHLGYSRAAGDGRQYFAQLHSLVIDGDLNFANEAADFGAPMPALFPIGSAILWLPFYLAAHVWGWCLHLLGRDVVLDGYGPPYQMAVGLGSVAYALAGCVLAYRVAREYFSPAIALGSVVLAISASPLIWYLAIDPSWSHGTSMFSVTLFLYAWHSSRGKRSLAQWAILGAAAGLMALVRWQNVAFVLVPAVEAAAQAMRGLTRRDFMRLVAPVRGVLAAIATGLVVFLPQMYVWKVTNGGWLTAPHGQAGQMWWNDSRVIDVLFSSNHGLFAWHPALYVGTLGLLLFARRDWKFAALLAVCFVIQAYLNGAVSTWWGGSSFGGRRFDGLTLLFVLGLASAIQASLRRPGLVVSAVAAAFVAANGLLIAGVITGNLPVGEGLPAGQFAASAARQIGNPFSFPANAWFAWKYGGSLGDYDRVGRQLYSNIRIEFGDPSDDQFLTRGWWGRETDTEGSFRWSSGTSSGLWVSLLGARVVEEGREAAMPDYRLVFRAAPFDVPDLGAQRIGVEINGTEVAAFDMAVGFREYVVAVPGRRLGRGLNAIRFVYGYARSARETGLGDDPRVLAVRFDWLTFTQVTSPAAGTPRSN